MHARSTGACLGIDLSPASSTAQPFGSSVQISVRGLVVFAARSATVGSLATRMSRTTQTMEEFHTAFLSRIGSMGGVHDLLLGTAWRGASLRSLIMAAIEPYTNSAGTNVSMTGPEVILLADPAAAMGMVLNELAT